MKLAFSKPTANDQETETLFHEFGPAGYQGLQLKGGQYHAWLDKPAAFKEKYGHYTGVASALISGGGVDDTSMAKLDQVFRFGSAVGAERVIYCHGGKDHSTLRPGELKEFARIFSAAGKRAQDLGLKLSLHHHHGQPVMLRPDFEEFFGAVEPGTVGLTVDTAHLVKSGIDDIAGIITAFRDVIDNFHMKDYAAGDWKVLGQGDIDFKPVFAAIRSIGYNGWVSCDEESGAGLVEALRACHAFLAAGFAAHPQCGCNGH